MAIAALPLVGRDGELGRLDAAVHSAARGEPAFVLVLGEAGIGKTSLLQAAEASARDAGLRVLSGTAIESGRGIPYLPLISPLTTALGANVTDDANRVVRDALAARVTGAETERREDGPADFRAARLIEAMFEVLARTPTLLAVDDVHWADESTIAVLDYLAHRATAAPLAVICGARNDEPGMAALLPLADGRRFAQLEVRRLTRAETAAQARQLGRTLAGASLDTFHRRTAGNPFFVEQALADEATAAGSGGQTTVPVTLRALVTRRARRLSGDARTLVEAMAVVGRPVDPTLAAEIAALTGNRIRGALDVAVEAGIAVSGPYGIALRHPLFNEAIHAELATSRKQALHRRAADALERSGTATGPAELASHWWRAGDRERTWRASMAAAAAAASAYAFAEQQWHLEHAIEAWPDTEPDRGRAMLAAARAAWMSGDPEAAVRLAGAAEGTEVPLVEATVAHAEFAWDTGAREIAVELFERVAPMLDEIEDPSLRTRALWGLGRARVASDPNDSVDLALRAAELAALGGDANAQAEALALAAMARAWDGSLEGVPELEASLGLALGARAPSSTGHAFQFLCELLTVGGQTHRALEVALRGIEVCERFGVARFHGSDLRGRAGMLLIELGRWAEVDPVLAPADPRALVGLTRLVFAIRRGDDGAGRVALEEATTQGGIGGRGVRGGYLELALAESAWLSGDDRTAINQLDQIRLSPGIWHREMSAWQARWQARLAPGAVDPEDIRERLRDCPDPHAGRAMLAEVDAELAERRERVDATEAVAWWVAAAEAWQSAGRPYDAAVARLRQAEAGFRSADREAARGALHAASATFSELGARPMLRRAEDLARRARVAAHEPQRRRAEPDELTERERDVLALLAEGLTNPQIADRLFLSRKTVGIHVSRILDKLGARTRGEAVAAARRRGIVA